jgi:hypothetical protein
MATDVVERMPWLEFLRSLSSRSPPSPIRPRPATNAVDTPPSLAARAARSNAARASCTSTRSWFPAASRKRIKIVETLKEREETYTVFEKKPVSRKYSKECCYLEKEVKSKLITIESCRRVELPVTLVDSVNVCVPEMQEGVRRREVCTECGKICIEEPCTCMINRAEKVARVQNGTRQDVVFEETTKTIDYCVISPKYHTIDCGEETTCELVPVTKTRKVQVCVPEAVKVPCDVEVTKMVAKNICCCDVCWCAMQEQAAQDAKHAKHKKDCN